MVNYNKIQSHKIKIWIIYFIKIYLSCCGKKKETINKDNTNSYIQGNISHKKEHIWVSFDKVDEPRIHHTQGSKSEREKQISHFNTYMWNLERLYWWTYLQGSIGDKGIDNRWHGREESSEFQRQKGNLKRSQETL